MGRRDGDGDGDDEDCKQGRFLGGGRNLFRVAADEMRVVGGMYVELLYRVGGLGIMSCA